MISRTLIDLLNSGEAVSIVGSGISADAGIPTWDGLFNAVADELDRENHDTKWRVQPQQKANFQKPSTFWQGRPTSRTFTRELRR